MLNSPRIRVSLTRKILIIIAACGLLGTGRVHGEAMLQLFNLTWNQISDKMPELAEAGYQALYTFGDSYIDSGNYFSLTGLPPSPPYARRLSNGPTAIEYLAQDLGIAAQQITVHPNTVAKAYQELERQGILEAKRGRGMEVTADAPRVCRVKRQEIIRGRIRDALREAVASALPPDEVRQLVEEELHRVNGKAHR